MALSDRIVVMNQGRVEQIGPPHEAYERPATPFVASFLGKTNDSAGRSIGATPIGAGSWSGRHRWRACHRRIRPRRSASAEHGSRKVRTRIFQGNHWLYQVDTDCRPVDRDPPEHGEAHAGRGRGGAPRLARRGHGVRRRREEPPHERSAADRAPRRRAISRSACRRCCCSSASAGPAGHDGAAVVPRLGPVQGHRAGLHPEELARGARPTAITPRCSGGPSASPCW